MTYDIKYQDRDGKLKMSQSSIYVNNDERRDEIPFYRLMGMCIDGQKLAINYLSPDKELHRIFVKGEKVDSIKEAIEKAIKDASIHESGYIYRPGEYHEETHRGKTDEYEGYLIQTNQAMLFLDDKMGIVCRIELNSDVVMETLDDSTTIRWNEDKREWSFDVKELVFVR